jgi:hypothetical protein
VFIALLLGSGLAFGVFLGDVTGNDSNAAVSLLQFGILGVFAFLFVIGKIHSDSEYRRVLADKDAAEQQRNKAAETFQDKVLPALVESNLRTSEVVELIRGFAIREVGHEAAPRRGRTDARQREHP